MVWFIWSHLFTLTWPAVTQNFCQQKSLYYLIRKRFKLVWDTNMASVSYGFHGGLIAVNRQPSNCLPFFRPSRRLTLAVKKSLKYLKSHYFSWPSRTSGSSVKNLFPWLEKKNNSYVLKNTLTTCIYLKIVQNVLSLIWLITYHLIFNKVLSTGLSNICDPPQWFFLTV